MLCPSGYEGKAGIAAMIVLDGVYI